MGVLGPGRAQRGSGSRGPPPQACPGPGRAPRLLGPAAAAPPGPKPPTWLTADLHQEASSAKPQGPRTLAGRPPMATHETLLESSRSGEQKPLFLCKSMTCPLFGNLIFPTPPQQKGPHSIPHRPARAQALPLGVQGLACRVGGRGPPCIGGCRDAVLSLPFSEWGAGGRMGAKMTILPQRLCRDTHPRGSTHASKGLMRSSCAAWHCAACRLSSTQPNPPSSLARAPFCTSS
mmetsp:Transcript_59277/g.145531  ORF Transcript_59277/g.145531 Transcript_59277/m.145531 type:complete len:233 (+) Transcript_59277:165-863(+)